MRSGVWALIALLALTGCRSLEEQHQYEMEQASVAAGEDLVALPADARTRAKAHTELAAAYYELGNMGVALEETRVALSADPTYPPAYNVQGLVRMDLRDNAGAEQSFQHGLKLAPQDADLNHNYGWFLCRTGRASQSVQWFMNAVKNPLYKTPARSYAAAGQCMADVDAAQAADYFEHALRLDPNSIGALLPYAELKYRQDDLDGARALVARFEKVAPEPTAESLWLALRIERKQGDRATEGKLAAQLRKRYPGSPQAQALARSQYD